MGKVTFRTFMFVCCLSFAFGIANAHTIRIRLYHASYSVSRNDLQIGAAEFTLSRNPDGSYLYRSVTQPVGLAALFFSDVITESSQFLVKSGRLESLVYSYTHSGDEHDDTEHIRFDWSDNSAESNDGKKHKTIPIEPGVYDRALAQLAVSLDLASGRLADGYRVLDHGEISDYHMLREADAKLTTPAGEYQVIKVARKDVKKKRTTTFWLAPELDYLPVQIEQTEPGKATISLTLTDIHFDTAAGSRIGASATGSPHD
jgi:Protein of unknown function (DUF3108)